MSINWELSVLDRRDQGINDHHDHPAGVYRTRCSHSLMVTPLRDTSCGNNARRA
jgi:hypothetical protein